MALIKCEKCGHLISDKAEACPKCGQLRTAENTETEIKNFEDGSNGNPERNHGGGLKWLIIVIALLVAGGGVGYYIYVVHKSKEAAAIAKKARLDSIAAVEAARLDSIRQDSIKYEEEHRFLPTVFIHEELTRSEWNPLLYERPLKSNWEQILISQGFVKGETKTLYVDEREYEEELYDIGAVLYTRNINGRCITVKAYLFLYKQCSDGSIIPINERAWRFIENSHMGQSFEIDFSDLQDLDTFWDALKSLGLSKYHRGIGSGYGLRDQRKKDAEYVCPSTSFHRDRNTITIFADVDC